MIGRLSRTIVISYSKPASYLHPRSARYLQIRPLTRHCKRFCDLLIAVAGIILTFPLFIVIAIAIKLDSSGPVFFLQERVGLHRRRFLIWKFRKMHAGLTQPGPSLTKRHDVRLARIGRLLERTKLDELPQLINVFFGQMSIVGPRPELPKFVDQYPAEWNDVLSVKPGLVGPNQLRYRNESELYPPACRNIETYYIDHILPEKLKVDAAYSKNLSLGKDLILLLQCFVATLLGTLTWDTFVTRRWQIANTFILSSLGVSGMLAANWLTSQNLSTELASCSIMLACLIKPGCLVAFRIPKALATSMTADDFLRIWWCAVTSASAIVTGILMLDVRGVGRLIVLLDTTFFLALLVMYKLFLYTLHLTFFLRESRGLARRMILTSVAAAPLSMMAVGGCHHGFALWTTAEGAWQLSLTGLLTVIRPLIMLLMPIFPCPSVGAWLCQEWRKLLVGSLVGSSFGVFGSLFLNERAFSRVDVVVDSLVYCIIMSGVSLWFQKTGGRKDRFRRDASESFDKLLVVGESMQINAYITGASGLRGKRSEIVGVITPEANARTSMIGEYPILGNPEDMADILETWSIKRIIVIKPIADKTTLQYVEELARSGNIDVIEIDLGAGLTEHSRSPLTASLTGSH